MKIRFLLPLILFFLGISCSPKHQQSYSPSTSPSQQQEPPKTLYSVYENGEYVLTKLDQEPSPTIGGKDFLMQVYSSVKYPPEARAKSVQGIVHTSIVINELGQLEEATVTKGIGAGCDEAALLAIREGCANGFTPAMKDGKAVKVKYDVPLKFSLH